MAFWAYVLISETTGRRYVGHTDDLDRRVVEHNSLDHNVRKFTSRNAGPWALVHSELFATRGDVTRPMHGGQYGQCTIEGMERFFERWTQARPLVFVKYEALYDHLPDIAKALGVHFRRFPPHRPRKSHPPEDVPERLLALRGKFDALPNFLVRL